MGMVESFDRQVIARYLEETELKFMIDQSGNFVVIFKPSESRPQLTIRLSCEAEGSVYVVRGRIPDGYPADQEPRLVSLVNRWNREYRWPKAFVTSSLDGSPVAVVTEVQLPVASGAHHELVVDFTNMGIMTSEKFFSWLTDQLSLPTVEELEEMYKAAS